MPVSTRHKIASQFGIGKTRPTHVVGNMVQDDGYEIKNVESALSESALNAYTGADTDDMEVLWTTMIDKIEGRERVIPPMEETKDQVIEIPVPEPVKKTRKVTKSKTKKK